MVNFPKTFKTVVENHKTLAVENNLNENTKFNNRIIHLFKSDKNKKPKKDLKNLKVSNYSQTIHQEESTTSKHSSFSWMGQKTTVSEGFCFNLDALKDELKTEHVKNSKKHSTLPKSQPVNHKKTPQLEKTKEEVLTEETLFCKEELSPLFNTSLESFDIKTVEGMKSFSLDQKLETTLKVEDFCKILFSQDSVNARLSDTYPLFKLCKDFENTGFDLTKSPIEVVALKKSGHPPTIVTLDNRRALAINLAYQVKKEKFPGDIPVIIYGGNYEATNNQRRRFGDGLDLESIQIFQNLYNKNYNQNAYETITIGGLALSRINQAQIKQPLKVIPYEAVHLIGSDKETQSIYRMAKKHKFEKIKFL